MRKAARAKQRSRDGKHRALASGKHSREDLRRENGNFADAPMLRIHPDLAKPLR